METGAKYQTDGYKSLVVRQKSYTLTLEVYKLSKLLPKDEIYGLTSQWRRATSSIPINITEGYSRSSSKEFLQFLYIAKGSCAEIETIHLLLKDIGYIGNTAFDNLENNRCEVARLLQGLINKIKNNN